MSSNLDEYVLQFGYHLDEYKGKRGKESKNILEILMVLEMKLDNEENTVIEQTRPRVVVQMHIMGATICPSTFQDTPQPLKSNWTTFSPKLMCHNIIKYKTSLSI